MNRLSLLVYLSALVLILPASLSFAQTCDSNHYNMLDWMTLDAATTDHLTGPQNLPLYTVLPSGGLFWWIKGDHSGQGYPWDVQYYDSTYIYQWITDYDPYSYTDPHYYKAFNSKTGLPWTPICVPKTSPWGNSKLSSITVPSASTAYRQYSNCSPGSTMYLGNTVNEVWDNGNLNIGGNLGTNPSLALVYRYSCDSNYNNCKYKEVYDFIQSFGEVQWTYYVLQSNGTYQQQNQSTFNDFVGGGSPPPDFPCGLP
jgi:hypothetical protein